MNKLQAKEEIVSNANDDLIKRISIFTDLHVDKEEDCNVRQKADKKWYFSGRHTSGAWEKILQADTLRRLIEESDNFYL